MRSAVLLFVLAAAAPAFAAPRIVQAPGVVVRVVPLGMPERLEPDAIVSAYANLSIYKGASLIHGGVSSNGSTTSTLFVADDLVPDPQYAGANLTSVRFTAANYNPDPVTVRISILLLNPDGPSGKPGSLIMGIIADGMILQPLGVSVISVAVQAPPGIFTMPGGPFWAGMAFDDHDGTWSVTPTQLSSLGQAYFGPPTTGSSENRLFITTTPFTPDGTILTRSSEPSYDFGWEFNVDDTTPVHASTWGRLKTLYR